MQAAGRALWNYARFDILHLTQPTLSRRLKELEEELKVKLFARHSHGISLTQDGRRLRKRAEEILDLAEKTCSEFSQGDAAVNGDIYLGAGETRAIYPVTEIIGDIRKEHPAIRFHFYNGTAQDVSERLDKGLPDFGIFIQPADILKYEHLNLPI